MTTSTKPITWDFTEERARLHALAGSGFGDTFAEALPAMTKKKEWEAGRTAKSMSIGANDVVAELGSGIGIVAKLIAQQCKHIHCIDISEVYLDECRKWLAEIQNASFHRIPIGDFSSVKNLGINKIYAEGVFIHFNLYDLKIYLDEIASFLPKGGLLAFNYVNSEFDELFSNEQWVEHFNVYKQDKTKIVHLLCFHAPSTVKQFLDRSGFVIENILDPEWLYPWIVARKR